MAKRTNFSVNGKEYFRVTRTIGHKPDGTPIRKFFYGSGIKEANEKANEYMENIKNGMNLDYKKLTINQLLDTWLYEIKLKDSNWKPGTFTKYEGVYRNYIKESEISNITVFNCKTLFIQKYYNKLSDEGKTENQIKSLNKVLKGAFNYAVQEGYTSKNPCAFVSLPKTTIENFDETWNDEDEDIQIYDNDTIAKIIKICYNKIQEDPEDYFYYMILLDLGSGLRQAELLGIQRKYIDTIVRVRKQLQKIKKFVNKKSAGYEYKLIPPKTASSNRNVDLPEFISKLITSFKNIQKIKWEKQGKTFNDDSLIFTTSTCNYIDSANLLKRWKKFLEEHGIEYKKWHVLRHCFASLLFQAGADIKTVQELLGHADINTTLKIYIHVFPETKKKAINSLNTLFSY